MRRLPLRRLVAVSFSRMHRAMIVALLLLAPMPGMLHAQGAGGGGGLASLGGTVMSDPSEKPLPNAEIVFTKLNLNARSDSAGNFVIVGVPAGRHEVVFRLVGYEPITTTLAFTPGQKLEGDFLLKQLVTTLGKVDVKGTAVPAGSDSRMVEFEARRKMGSGRFITQDVFEKAEGRSTSDIILSKIPGLHANAMGSGEKAIASSRGLPSQSGVFSGTSDTRDAIDKAKGVKVDCYVQVVVNGVVMYQLVAGRPFFDINSIPSHILMGLEYYTVAQTPQQYNLTGSDCGTLVLWTRTR